MRSAVAALLSVAISLLGAHATGEQPPVAPPAEAPATPGDTAPPTDTAPPADTAPPTDTAPPAGPPAEAPPGTKTPATPPTEGRPPSAGRPTRRPSASPPPASPPPAAENAADPPTLPIQERPGAELSTPKSEKKKKKKKSKRKQAFRIGLHVHARYTIRDEDGADLEHEFGLRRARVAALYRADKLLEAEVDFDVSDSPSLKDAFLELRAAKWFRVRGGQFRKPFGRIALMGPSSLELISRGHVDDLLVRGLGFGGRDRGVMISGKASALRYSLGAFNGTGTLDEIDSGKDAAARIEVEIADPVRVGASGSMKYRNPRGLTQLPQKAVGAAGIDFALDLGVLDVVAEGVWAQERTLAVERDSVGVVAFAVGHIAPLERVGLYPVIAGEMIHPDLDLDTGTIWVVRGGPTVRVHETVRIMLQAEGVFAPVGTLVGAERSVTLQLAFDEKLKLALVEKD